MAAAHREYLHIKYGVSNAFHQETCKLTLDGIRAIAVIGAFIPCEHRISLPTLSSFALIELPHIADNQIIGGTGHQLGWSLELKFDLPAHVDFFGQDYLFGEDGAAIAFELEG
jgi:hypothetical protein